jgi:glucose 1-dehydrogenase
MKNSPKVVAITGAARGIGKACAARFLADGARVVISDVDAAGLVHAAQELGHDDRLRTVEADVSKRADVDRIVAHAVKEFGRLDVMVNNAGVARNRDFLEISEAEFDDVMGINLKGAFFGVQAAARQMIAQGGGGVVVNMSSVNALLAIPSLATYAMSKGAMKQLTSVAAVALAPHGIRVVAVGPVAYAGRPLRRAERGRFRRGLPRQRRCLLHHGTNHLPRRRAADPQLHGAGHGEEVGRRQNIENNPMQRSRR